MAQTRIGYLNFKLKYKTFLNIPVCLQNSNNNIYLIIAVCEEKNFYPKFSHNTRLKITQAICIIIPWVIRVQLPDGLTWQHSYFQSRCTWSANLAVCELAVPLCVEIVANWAGGAIGASLEAVVPFRTTVASAVRWRWEESSQKTVIAWGEIYTRTPLSTPAC